MNFAICLDPNSPNFSTSTLSSNGFSVYSNADNFTTPVAQNIPLANLLPPPNGNCPTIVSIPQGATQIIVIDQCDDAIDTAAIFNPVDVALGNLATNCCYSIINLPPNPLGWCVECGIEFDTFQTSSIGRLIAGNVISSCGPVTDYVIGWYLNGNYSAPAITTGYGTTFPNYQFPHPLTGNSAAPVLAGSYEGIIHDIIINGITYSSISGSANGIPIPFESCFSTVVVDPLSCDNGLSPGKYSHQITFNSQTPGTTSSPSSLTYQLSPSTQHFAYVFGGFSIWDEIEIKWISGDPSATSNPSLYLQPIYLEKLRVGFDAQQNIPYQIYESTFSLPGSYPSNIFDGQYSSVNNTWPKYTQNNGLFQRVLTLTTLETSSNPAAPDLLEITITPNPTNNNTQWVAGFQCLDTFDCTDCFFNNYPSNLPKIWKIELDKVDTGCDAQRLILYQTSSCTPNSDWMGLNISMFGIPGISNPNINLIGGSNSAVNDLPHPESGYIPLKDNTTCSSPGQIFIGCGPSSTGTINFNQSPGQIQLTFDLEIDYLHYKNTIQGIPVPASPIPCPAGSTSVTYYRTYGIRIPIQGANVNCGDNSTDYTARFHRNDIFNVQYVENPSSNFWSITIPQTSIINCYPQNQSCDSCYNLIQNFVNSYNSSILQSFSFTTNVGAKFANPFAESWVGKTISAGASGSYCDTRINTPFQYFNNGEASYYPWYGTNTIPFVSSSTGWVNLPSLGTFIPCSDKTGSYPIEFNHSILGLVYLGKTTGYSVRFPSLTSSFDYSLSTNDFEIYAEAGFGVTGSSYATTGSTPPPCPDPLSALIYSYTASVATVYTSSHFWQGNNPTLIIDP